MITRTSEYALRAVVFLAGQGDRCVASREIAGTTHVPPGYLPKVLQALARSGLLRAQRGLRGGYRLARAASQIRLLDVLNSIGPIGRIQCCPLDPRELAASCPLHRRLRSAMALVEEALGEVTIADLLEEFKETPPPCWGPTAV